MEAGRRQRRVDDDDIMARQQIDWIKASPTDNDTVYAWLVWRGGGSRIVVRAEWGGAPPSEQPAGADRDRRQPPTKLPYRQQE